MNVIFQVLLFMFLTTRLFSAQKTDNIHKMLTRMMKKPFMLTDNMQELPDDHPLLNEHKIEYVGAGNTENVHYMWLTKGLARKPKKNTHRESVAFFISTCVQGYDLAILEEFVKHVKQSFKMTENMNYNFGQLTLALANTKTKFIQQYYMQKKYKEVPIIEYINWTCPHNWAITYARANHKYKVRTLRHYYPTDDHAYDNSRVQGATDRIHINLEKLASYLDDTATFSGLIQVLKKDPTIAQKTPIRIFDPLCKELPEKILIDIKNRPRTLEVTNTPLMARL